MKKTLYLLALLFLGACNSYDEIANDRTDDSLEQKAFITVPDTGTVITLEMVNSIAMNYQNGDATTRSTSKEIESINCQSDEAGNPLMYIVNYKDNNGFIIISANKEYYPVLAYSDNGHFNLSQTYKNGTTVWLNEQKTILNSIKQLPDSIRAACNAMWFQYNTRRKEVVGTQTRASMPIGVFDLIASSVNQWINEGYTVCSLADYSGSDKDDLVNIACGYGNANYGLIQDFSFVLIGNISVYHSIPPLLQSTWGQQYGYNQYVPNNIAVGCVPVALAQIMKYHQYPTRFDWSAMANDYATSATASLLLDIRNKLGMQNDESDSNIDKALAALKNSYSYGAALKISHDAYKVNIELDNRRPVYMRGYDSSGFMGFSREGHAWVCDGYNYAYTTSCKKLMTLEYCPEDREPTCFLNPYTSGGLASYSPTYYHMNWGWYGDHNGYFLDDNLWMTVDGKSLNLAHGREDIIKITHN